MLIINIYYSYKSMKQIFAIKSIKLISKSYTSIFVPHYFAVMEFYAYEPEMFSM